MSLKWPAGGDCDAPEMTSENRKPNSRGRRVARGLIWKPPKVFSTAKPRNPHPPASQIRSNLMPASLLYRLHRKYPFEIEIVQGKFFSLALLRCFRASFYSKINIYLLFLVFPKLYFFKF